jgi:hypothetical protein
MMRDFIDFIKDAVGSFLFQEHHPEHVVYGQEYRVRRTLKTGNVALLVSVIALILVIILHG